MRCQRLQTEGIYGLIECHDIVSLLQAANGKDKNDKAVRVPLLAGDSGWSEYVGTLSYEISVRFFCQQLTSQRLRARRGHDRLLPPASVSMQAVLI